jgi:hypothetical protein
LIDGKSLLYHVALEKTDLLYASPATIYESCQVYIRRMLKVVGKKGGVHVFFDGLAPLEKVESQIKRMGQQATAGDILATQNQTRNSKVKLLHHLAEWAFVEAIETLRQRFSATLFMYRPARGEGEAMINQWLVENDSIYSRVAIISEDSDFLVYDSCPGFIPPSSVVYEEEDGRHCLKGKYYLRSKFLRSFLGQPSTTDSTVMTTVATLAGCDYVHGLPEDQLKALTMVRHRIVSSHLGGLRVRYQNKPKAVNALLAVVRVVAHYKKAGGCQWLEQLCSDFARPCVATAVIALRNVHAIYFHSLQVNTDSITDLVPGIVEARRLIQLGIVFCYPLIETYNATDVVSTSMEPETCADISQLNSGGAPPNLPFPPLTTEVEKWITKSSVWNLPHFRQIRGRLYRYVRCAVRNAQIVPAVSPADLWTFDQDPAIKEVVRIRDISGWRMTCVKVKIPDHSREFTMFVEKLLTADDDVSMDRGLLFCLTGAPHQLEGLLAIKGIAGGSSVLVSLMLPFNLACLLLMMATAPKEITKWGIPLPAFNSPSCREMRKVLPILSVAYAHANLVAKTLTTIWANKGLEPSLCSPPVHVSNTFRHDTALLIWDALRSQINLEHLTTQSTVSTEATEVNVCRYLDGCFDSLGRRLPNQNEEWQKALLLWKQNVSPLYQAWWQIFNLV